MAAWDEATQSERCRVPVSRPETQEQDRCQALGVPHNNSVLAFLPPEDTVLSQKIDTQTDRQTHVNMKAQGIITASPPSPPPPPHDYSSETSAIESF
ncbi:hypothetical protein EYF80_025751 [Liparis tanakae]|uniref:Uncharacterized protein n=1 Tax=Liparis tanakae TaxID=230148 RepID=A0A4Z2HDR3_9TELE|nr:hypothetical protein EYF80_025751 [Liparis tanakae]